MQVSRTPGTSQVVGHGEYFIRYAVACDIYARMAYGGRDLKTAATVAISELEANGGKGGVIGVDTEGRFAMAYSTPVAR